MALPDQQSSRAVLVGIDGYATPSDRPPWSAAANSNAVANNLARLSELLTDRAVWGLDPAHCAVLYNPADPRVILDAVREAAGATEALLVYFAGHGLQLNYESLRAELVFGSKASVNTVVLDCCYPNWNSFGAQHGLPQPTLPEEPGGSGITLLSAATQAPETWAPPSERYTIFTGELIRTLEQGVPDAPEELTATAVDDFIRRQLTTKGSPVHLTSSVESAPGGGPIFLFANKFGGQDGAAASGSGTSSGASNAKPTDEEAADLALTAPAFAARLREIRVSGRNEPADRLLAMMAASGDSGEVALLLVLLRLEQRDREADLALDVIVARPADHPAEVALGLLRLGNSEECGRLLAAAARRPAVQVALLAQALSVRGCEAQTAQLLAEAGVRAAASSSLPALAIALLESDMAGPGKPALAAAIRDWTADRVLALAEELDAAGAGTFAFAIYAHAGPIVAEHWPADRIAALMRRMSDAGAEESVSSLLEAAARTTGAFPSMTAYLATALVMVDLPDSARQLIDRVAPRLSDGELEALTSYLDAGRQSALSVRAFAAAALDRPATATIAYMDVLRRHSQSTNADKLLAMVVTARPALASGLLEAFRAAGRPHDETRLFDVVSAADPGLCAAVAGAFWMAGAQSDVNLLVNGLMNRPLSDVAVAITSFSAFVASSAGGGQSAAAATSPAYNPFAARLLDRPTHEFVTAIRDLRGLGNGEQADRLVEALCDGTPELVAASALGLARARLPQDAGTLLDHFGTRAAPDAVAQVFLHLWRAGGDGTGVLATASLTGRRDSAPVLAAIRRAGGGEAADRHIAWLARALPVDGMIALCVSLSDQDAVDEVEAMLTHSAARDDVEALRAALHQAGRHALAYHLAERRSELMGTG
ncbi:MAG TPA: hypothetical protein VFU73_03935 [Actinocrinis sp.]|nr:hypothetical protein [Actinocrinis sp.]